MRNPVMAAGSTSRFFALMILAVSLAACNLVKQDCARSDVFCVGLVTDTNGLQDHGFTQSGWNEIERAQTEGVIRISAYVESVDTRDYGKNIDLFARQNYDVIVTAGVGLGDETLQAADRYPATVFIGLDQQPEDSRPNLITITFPEDQAGFLAGALAAQVTETGVIGATCETSSIASNWRACEGFRAGARYEDPQVKVLIAYRDNGSRETLFRDTEWGYATALELIREGADVIFGVGGGTGEAALAAAADSGVHAIGSERDQFHVTREAQDVLLTSLVKQASPAIYDLIRTVQSGAPVDREYAGLIEFASFHSQDGQIPEQAKQKLFLLKMELAEGILKTGIEVASPK